ncbi:MAG TPA: hypothetical protein VER98_02385, partial [Terriglobia bacterium]|nr:hypothetical protein [Terriglobia bacterium]
YISDSNNHRVRKVTPNGIITTIAGTGSAGYAGDGIGVSVPLWSPTGLAVDRSGAILIADSNNQRVRKLSPNGVISTIAGDGNAGFSADGPALSARLFTPSSLAVDSTGNIYLADTNNERVRKITLNGIISTIAGTGVAGYNGDDGPATAAELYAPLGIALDTAGILFVADSFNRVIRKISFESSATFSILSSKPVSSQSAGSSSEISTGYATIHAYNGSDTPSGEAILALRNNDVLVSEASVPASPAIQSGRIQADVNGRVNTGLAMANPNDQPATVTFFFTDAAGDFGNSQMTIPANGHISAFLNQAPFNGPSSISGTFTFSSSVPVAVTALRGFTNERSEFLMTTLPVVDLGGSPIQGTVWIPQFADGGGWTTEVVLINPTDTTLNGVVRFTDPSGTTLSLNANGIMGQDFVYSIPPRGSQTFRTSAPATSNITAGSVRVIGSPASAAALVPAAIAIFAYQNNGITVAETGVPAVPSGTAFRLYTESSGDFAHAASGSIQTGLAVANTTGRPVTAGLTLTLNTSSRQSTGSLTIPPNGQVAIFLDQISGLDAAQPPYQGVLRLQSPVPVSVIGLRARYNERGDFLISTSQPVDELTPPSNTPLFFPQFGDSKGYTTQFILFSGDAVESKSGFLTFFTTSGSAVHFAIE